jgi:hypothetical protein
VGTSHSSCRHSVTVFSGLCCPKKEQGLQDCKGLLSDCGLEDCASMRLLTVKKSGQCRCIYWLHIAQTNWPSVLNTLLSLLLCFYLRLAFYCSEGCCACALQAGYVCVHSLRIAGGLWLCLHVRTLRRRCSCLPAHASPGLLSCRRAGMCWPASFNFVSRTQRYARHPRMSVLSSNLARGRAFELGFCVRHLCEGHV